MDNPNARPAMIRRYRRLARRIIEIHFGKPPSRIVYRSSGLTNYVFLINHVEGQFVVRISPNATSAAAFKKELWTTQKVREVGVPSPEVLAVGTDIISEPYMISRRVSGSEATHHPQRRSIIHEMARYAAIINSVKTKGFGMTFDWAEGAPSLTWAEYLEQEFKLEERRLIFTQHRILPESKLEKLFNIINSTKTMPFRPSLNHSDLRLKNVIVDDDGQIAAIVDWEESLSTIAPQWELSIALHDLSIDEKHSFIEGYGLSMPQLEEMALLIKAFNIINYSSAIERAAETNDQKVLSELKLRLSGLLDLYSL